MVTPIPSKIKIDDKWYRTREEVDGTLNFKDDLNYYGSTTQIEYIAQKPNPILHPGLFHLFNMSGSKVGEFWTDPHVSYSGCITAMDINTSNNNNSTVDNSSDSSDSSDSSSSPRIPARKQLEGFWDYFWAFVFFIVKPFIDLYRYKGCTAPRIQWWSTLIRMFVLFFILTLILTGVDPFSSKNIFAQIIAVIFWFGIPLLPIIVFSLKRMQDINRPWWWILIPGANIIMCGFFPGKEQ